jgi:hypothetical protein
MRARRSAVTLMGTVLLAMHIQAQEPLPTPQASPAASVTQTVGIASLSVSYHRPGIKGREIWGALVPYDKVWRAGANENTTVSVSHPVFIEGQALAPGTYGLHMIPRKGTWTVIFSSNSTSWGSYFYSEQEDALRVEVTPEEAPRTEWLTYQFEELTDSSAVLALRWDRVRLPIPITMDTEAYVIANARDAYLRGLAGFSWQGYQQAASYCLRHNRNLEEGLAWIDRSIEISETFTNLRTKAGILELLGRAAEAQALREKSLRLATEAEVNALGYQFLGENRVEEALEMFRMNVIHYPNSWNAYDSLAEGLERAGDIEGAIINYRQAFALVTNPAQKERIKDTLTRLRAQ